MNFKNQKLIITKTLSLVIILFTSISLVHAQTPPPTYYGTNAGTTGDEGTFIGYNAGMHNTNDHNTFIGFESGKNNRTGRVNTYVGTFTGRDRYSTGSYNSFFGHGAGQKITSGSYNTYLGVNAGKITSSGLRNTIIGANAGAQNTTGYRNVFLGYRAGYYGNNVNKLIIDTQDELGSQYDRYTPLVYGDFAKHYVGIAISTNPADNDIILDANGDSPYGLYVGKGILTEKVKVADIASGDWSDYVFEADYDLNSPEEVEAFVKENKHLPNVPSAKEVSKNGIDMVEMDATLLRQIEELWLHVIELKKENDILKEEVKILKKQ